MKLQFAGWDAVAQRLQMAADKVESNARLNVGQRASLRAIASRIVQNGVVIADEVGMGKTRIAVELARCVNECEGRVAILVPPGLGYQWQDELRKGGLDDVPPILRSLHAYLAAWDAAEPASQQPWFNEKTLMVSHAFTNWRLGERADPWRWALLPELYARWRKLATGRFPNEYHVNEKLQYRWPCNAAASIADAVASDRYHPARRLLDQLLEEEWPRLLDPAEYGKYGALRAWLEIAIGFGLGVFDLIIIDEAHKSRDTGSTLSGLLERVIASAETGRRIALTATPVELKVEQWIGTLSRLRLGDSTLARVREVIALYAAAVNRVRQTWRSSSEAREAYRHAAVQFQQMLLPYLIRRDKREDPDVQQFHEYTGLPINAYRREIPITVETDTLSPAWRKAICAAEALSLVTHHSSDPVAKRLRLTLGNGHGIAALMDQIKRDEVYDRKQEEYDGTGQSGEPDDEQPDASDLKRQQRGEWWLTAITKAFAESDASLFEHPAIVKAVEVIEAELRHGEKVLVFGRFTRPLRALVDLLNAREMLRRIENNEPWPQAKVHGDRSGTAENGEWPAVRAAHRQLASPLSLDTLDARLRSSYDRESYRREQFREHLISSLEQGFQMDSHPGAVIQAIFHGFKRSVKNDLFGENRSVALVARALMELLEEVNEPSAPDQAREFCELITAVSDKDDTDENSEMDDERAAELWETIEHRLAEEYDRPQGGFARLMFGETAPESRRMIQLAFNRPKSFPRVLVAQSLVGREGLNLHKACRTVVLLHPEWNPGVVEQQIGRVDRVDSRWCHELERAITSGTQVDLVPRIEVRPVIFRGTYDEHNWTVLRGRWDDLRAQLHGIVIPPSEVVTDPEGKALVEQISAWAPNFSPLPPG
jgi:superfamily II DNA or RNA helicase